MRIGTVADRTGVSQRLLRYYEEQGLLHPARDANGYRTYTETDVVAVGHIRHLLAAGLPTAVIAELLGCVHDDGGRPANPNCPEMQRQLERQYARATETMRRLQHSREIIASMLGAQSTDVIAG